MNRGIISEETERKEGLDRKNKNLKKTIKCALTHVKWHVELQNLWIRDMSGFNKRMT